MTAPSRDAAVALLRLFGLFVVARLLWRLGQPIWDQGIRDEYSQMVLGIAGSLAVIFVVNFGLLAAIVWGIHRRLEFLAGRPDDDSASSI